MSIEPVKKYPGRKGAAGTMQQILSRVPRCELFIDCMAGSGFISYCMEPTGCRIIVNDADEAVLNRIKIYEGGKITKVCCDYAEIVCLYDNNSEGTVFYFDPPYLFETRKSQRDIYGLEWDRADHLQFLDIVRKIGSSVLVSHYPCPLYDEALKDWRKIEYTTMTYGGPRIEALYMNYPAPALLQCYKAVGENFTDRQRIKRKVERLINKLKNEAEQERAAILSAVVDHFKFTDPKK